MPDWAAVEEDLVYDNYDSPGEDAVERAVTGLQSARPVEDAVTDLLDCDTADDEETDGT
jgi:hypothetical protein